MTERGDFRSIYTVLVDTPEFTDLPPEAQLVWFHLKLKMGPAGIDVIPAAEHVLSDTTGIPCEGVADAIEILSQRGFLARERNVLWLRNALKFEPSRNLDNDNHKKSIRKHISSLPKLGIVNDFADYYNLDRPFPKVIPSGYHRDTLPDHGRRSTEDGVLKTEDGKSTPSPREDVENSDPLLDWLNGHGSLVADCPLIKDPRARTSLHANFGPPEMRANAWKKPDGTSVPPGERPRILAAALLSYAGEGKRDVVVSEFAGLLRRAIRDECETPTGAGRKATDLSHWED